MKEKQNLLSPTKSYYPQTINIFICFVSKTNTNTHNTTICILVLFPRQTQIHTQKYNIISIYPCLSLYIYGYVSTDVWIILYMQLLFSFFIPFFSLFYCFLSISEVSNFFFCKGPDSKHFKFCRPRGKIKLLFSSKGILLNTLHLKV